jgi:hypothetical protein
LVMRFEILRLYPKNPTLRCFLFFSSQLFEFKIQRTSSAQPLAVVAQVQIHTNSMVSGLVWWGGSAPCLLLWDACTQDALPLKTRMPLERFRVIQRYGRPTGNTRLTVYPNSLFKHDNDSATRRKPKIIFSFVPLICFVFD